MGMIKNLLQQLLNKIEAMEQNGNVTETLNKNVENLSQQVLDKVEDLKQNENLKKNPMPFVVGGVVLILLLSFIMTSASSPKGIAEKYIDIAITAMNEGKIEDSDIRWIRDVHSDSRIGTSEAYKVIEFSTVGKKLALDNGHVKMNLKELKTIKESDKECIIRITFEVSGLHDGTTYNDEKSVDVVFTKVGINWKISRVN